MTIDMNEDDRANLKFLLTSSKEVLADWYKTVSEDDLSYASALLEVAKAEMIDESIVSINHVQQAGKILNKFILNK